MEDYKLAGQRTVEDLVEYYLIKHVEVDYSEWFAEVEDHGEQAEKGLQLPQQRSALIEE